MRGRWVRIAVGLAAAVATAMALAAALDLGRPSPTPSNAAASFAADNERAMQKMMAGMAVASTNDIDRDFVMAMVPHHQGAIDMAMAELRYGKNEALRRIAQGIVVEQKQEIVAMQHMLARMSPSDGPGTSSDLCTTQSTSSTHPSHFYRDR